MKNWAVLIFVAVLLATNTGTGFYCYEKGKAVAYSKVAKEVPTQTYNAQGQQNIANTYQNVPLRPALSLFSWGRFHLVSFDQAAVIMNATQRITQKSPEKPTALTLQRTATAKTHIATKGVKR